MLIIIDVDLGESYSFVATEDGYRDAYATIQSIQAQGHRVGGDVGKVMNFIH